MCKTHCILMLVALYVKSTQSSSWDFATVSELYLEFYLHGTNTHSEVISTGRTGKMTYDPVGNRLIFSDKGYIGNFILSYDLTTKKTEALVPRLYDTHRIEGIAFDPVENILFYYIDSTSTIYWSSLKSGFHNAYGNILTETSFDSTSTIAIESCRGFIYWTMIYGPNNLSSAIQRSRFDGSEKEVVIGTDLQMPECLVIDHQTQKLYWTDGTRASIDLPAKNRHFTIESADLDGKNRRVVYRETKQHQPKSLAVSEDSIYWSHHLQPNAWQLPKDPSTQAKPKEIPTSRPGDDIVTNYKIEQQLQGVHNCERLKSVLPNNSSTEENDSLDVINDISLRDVTVCQNFCFQGECSANDEGQPQCRCNGDYSGVRCEVNVCQGYCLNDGVCSLTEEKQPICQCREDYEGERCEESPCLKFVQ